MKKNCVFIICIIIVNALLILIDNKPIGNKGLNDTKINVTVISESTTVYLLEENEEPSTELTTEIITQELMETFTQESTENVTEHTSITLNNDLYGENEKLIYSFRLKNSYKKVTIAQSEENDYIVCRIGTRDNIELEFPEDKTDSYQKLIYSYYNRGGGAENLGLNLDYLHFEYNGLDYCVYREYSAVTEKTTTGYSIENPNLDSDNDGIKDITYFKGDIKSVKGSLSKLYFTKIEKAMA